MRRLLAVALVAAFSFPLVSPAFFAGAPEANLPACCRREGKHRCAMVALERDRTTGVAVRDAACMLFPPPPALPAHHGEGIVHSFPVISVELANYTAGRMQPEILLQISFARTRQKRGPPSSNLCEV